MGGKTREGERLEGRINKKEVDHFVDIQFNVERVSAEPPCLAENQPITLMVQPFTAKPLPTKLTVLFGCGGAGVKGRKDRD